LLALVFYDEKGHSAYFQAQDSQGVLLLPEIKAGIPGAGGFEMSLPYATLIVSIAANFQMHTVRSIKNKP
jgi:hypothetical protein